MPSHIIPSYAHEEKDIYIYFLGPIYVGRINTIIKQVYMDSQIKQILLHLTSNPHTTQISTVSQNVQIRLQIFRFYPGHATMIAFLMYMYDIIISVVSDIKIMTFILFTIYI